MSSVTRTPMGVNRPRIRTTGNGSRRGACATAGGVIDADVREVGDCAGGAGVEGGPGVAVGGDVGVGFGVVVGVGVDVGVGIGAGLGVGVGVGVGANSTMLVGADRCSSDPALLDTLRRTRSTAPTSAVATR